MKFSIGYRQAEDGSFMETVREFRKDIAEAYFPWVGQASGRSPIGADGRSRSSARKMLERDLGEIRDMGIRLNILFNANCYGAEGMSRKLEKDIVSTVSHAIRIAGVDSATTTSPAIAHILKKHFPELETRSSVNMKIGTIEGMAYLAHLFDGYYVQREHNRDIGYLRELKKWADANGKKLYLLANSGCLHNCSGQIFHDNLVAHEKEVSRKENMNDFMPYTCWNFLREARNWSSILKASWIRPEDLHNYEGLFETVKLATRIHEKPYMVVNAYASGKFRGNLADLFEPTFSAALAPNVIDNTKFPSDWFERTSTCRRNCEECGYCAEVMKKVLVNTEKYVGINPDNRRVETRPTQ
ncbi:MAG TPA: hypothetical protein DET40_04055 [Lentisphaeria bacterium]|nr:MAG: hypothetical protein A2X45_01885 [Lentisphaerae bacterium GWF2_50_93]HCE42700.1 hypothetical protein [Lentisphaeria bacterium]